MEVKWATFGLGRIKIKKTKQTIADYTHHVPVCLEFPETVHITKKSYIVRTLHALTSAGVRTDLQSHRRGPLIIFGYRQLPIHLLINENSD
jgi:hypothetical protein